MSKKFNEYRFEGLNYRSASNKYWTMNRVNDDETKIVVKVADCHLFETMYGYGLIIDEKHVVWLKSWAVSSNWYGNEVMLDKAYFNVKEAKKSFDDFDEEPESMDFAHWVEVAKVQQEAGNEVKWAK